VGRPENYLTRELGIGYGRDAQGSLALTLGQAGILSARFS
jgi:hypothetical protein